MKRLVFERKCFMLETRHRVSNMKTRLPQMRGRNKNSHEGRLYTFVARLKALLGVRGSRLFSGRRFPDQDPSYNSSVGRTIPGKVIIITGASSGIGRAA